jgi:hypothetical protein
MTAAAFQTAPQGPAINQSQVPPSGLDDAGEYLSLESRKKKFEDSQQLAENSRRLSEQDRDYYDHKQWSASEIAKLKLRGQVPIVINRIQRKVDTILGIQQRSAADPVAAPRNPQDEQAGEVATDSLRYVCDHCDYKSTKMGIFENLIIEGTGGAEVIVEKKGQYLEIYVKRLRWETVFWDGHSRAKDFKDAAHMGHATWMYVDDIEVLYGKDAKGIAEDSLMGMGVGGMAWGSYDDRPTIGQWLDYKNRRVLVVDMYCKYKGQWTRSVFCNGGDLIDPHVSEYTDEHGEPMCPMELASVYVDRENARYGIVRGMIGPQDEINYRRSKFLHLVSTRQTYGNSSAIDNVERAKRELSKPHGHVEMNGTSQYGRDFGVIDTTDMAQGQMEMLQEAKQEIDLLGPSPAVQGRQPDQIMGPQSGKAWQAQQAAGMAELATLYAALNDLSLRIYKQIWYRIRQYWDAPRFVRISDDANAYKFTYVNEPAVDEQGNPIFETDQMGQPVIDPNTGQPQQKMLNRPALMEVDLTVDEAPDVTNSMEEQFDKLVELAKLGMPIKPEVIIQASSIRNKRQILDQLQQQQGPPPVPPEEQAKIAQEDEKLRQSAIKTDHDAALHDAQTAKTYADIRLGIHNALKPQPLPSGGGRPKPHQGGNGDARGKI